MSRLAAVWRAATRSRATTILASIALLVTFLIVERVMAHGYGIDAQWGSDMHLELKPPVRASH